MTLASMGVRSPSDNFLAPPPRPSRLFHDSPWNQKPSILFTVHESRKDSSLQNGPESRFTNDVQEKHRSAPAALELASSMVVSERKMTLSQMKMEVAKILNISEPNMIKVVIGGRLLQNNDRDMWKVKQQWGARPFICMIPTDCLTKLHDAQLEALGISVGQEESHLAGRSTSLQVNLLENGTLYLHKGKHSRNWSQGFSQPEAPVSIGIKRTSRCAKINHPLENLNMVANGLQANVNYMPARPMPSPTTSLCRIQNIPIIRGNRFAHDYFRIQFEADHSKDWYSFASQGSVDAGFLTIGHIREHIVDELRWSGPGESIQLFFKNKELCDQAQTAKGCGLQSSSISRITVRLSTEPRQQEAVDLSRASSLMVAVHKAYERLSALQHIPKRMETVAPVRDCGVCGDAIPHSEFKDRITRRCLHDNNTCSSCLAHWISSELESKGWENIRCPECPAVLQYEEIREGASYEVFERYDILAMRSALSSDPNFRWCIRPGCTSGQIHISGQSSPMFTCQACSHVSCVKHNVAWHEDESCEQYEYRTSGRKSRDEEMASEKWVKENAKACPSCKWRIEKIDGCDHMTCRRCHHEFCWLCMADYEEIRDYGNRKHKKSCKHWRL